MNAWRSVAYTDDGCTEYQCLACKATWEARTSPAHAHWRFCPVCGTQWTGRLPDNEAGSEKVWERKSRYWQSKNAERARQLQLPWRQWEYFSHRFPEEGWQPDEAKPFQASARQAHDLRKHCILTTTAEMALVAVPSSEQFPLA
jgi:hypothetical protein